MNKIHLPQTFTFHFTFCHHFHFFLKMTKSNLGWRRIICHFPGYGGRFHINSVEYPFPHSFVSRTALFWEKCVYFHLTQVYLGSDLWVAKFQTLPKVQWTHGREDQINRFIIIVIKSIIIVTKFIIILTKFAYNSSGWFQLRERESRSKFLGPLCLWQCLDQGFTLHTSVFYLFWHEIHFAIHRTAVDKWNSPCTINSLKVLKCFPFSNKTRLPNEWELPKLWALKIFIMFNVDI